MLCTCSPSSTVAGPTSASCPSPGRLPNTAMQLTSRLAALARAGGAAHTVEATPGHSAGARAPIGASAAKTPARS